MNALLHSPLLQALGYAIIHSLWQFALLWLLYFFLNSTFKLSPHQKYTIGLVLEVAGFSWFAGTFIFYYNQCLQLTQTATTNPHPYFTGLLTNTTTSLKQKFFLFILDTEQFFPYLSLAYLALLCVLIGRWIYAYNYTRNVRATGILLIDESWQQFVTKLAGQLGIGRSVQIYLSEVVQTPLTVGFFKPFILIPLATINYLNTQQMEAVILHELAHIRRLDYLFNLLLAFVEACLFYNPFMQLINQQIKKERENCCDDWVLKYEYSPSSYARALLQIASHQTKSPLLALKATDNKQLLINRIKRIIEKKEHSFFNYKYQLLALLVMTFVFSLLSFLSPGRKAIATKKSIHSSNVVFEPLAAKVQNPLFNPVFFLIDSVKTVAEPKAETGELKNAKTFVEAPDAPKPQEGAGVEDDNSELPLAPVVAPLEASGVLHDKTTDLVINPRFERIDNFLKDSIALHFRKIEGEKWFAPEAQKQIEIQFRRAENGSLNEAGLSFDRLKLQLHNVFAQIKTQKKTTELGRLQGLVRAGIKRIEREKITSAMAEINDARLTELELLEKQIEGELDSTSQAKTNIYVTGYSSNLHYNIQVPAVAYTISPAEDNHKYSYEYSNSARVRVVTPPTTNKAVNGYTGRRQRVIIADNEEDTQNVEELALPPTPPGIGSKPKTIFIIKI